MPRKLLGRFLPNSHQLKKNKSMSLLGEWLHDPNLWHLNRRSVSGGVALGLFSAWIPLPLQMLIAAAMSVLLRVNLPISVVMVWITNPLTLAPMFYFAYVVGTWIIGVPEIAFSVELSMEWLMHELAVIWKPFLTGCLILGIISSAIGYFSISYIWVHMVMKRRRKKLSLR